MFRCITDNEYDCFQKTQSMEFDKTAHEFCQIPLPEKTPDNA